MIDRKWAFLIIVILVGVVYLPSLPGDFHFDDYLLLLDNPDVTADSFRFASFLDHYGGRPLTLLSFHWNYHLADRDPGSYVSVNIILHLLVCLLLFGWLRDVTKKPLVALGAALLFGLHPLQTQAVNYIWSRSMLLMACFALAALWAGKKERHVWSLVLFQLAIWSRTDAMAIAPFLLLQGTRTRALFVLLGLNTVGFLTGLYLHAPAETAWQHSNVWNYWLAQPAVLLKYLTLMLWPVGLSIDHHIQPGWVAIVLSALLLAALGYAFYRVRQREPQVALAGLWMLLLLAPAAVIPNGDLFNESRSYLALAGFAFLMSWGLLQMPAANRQWVGRTAVGVILVLLASITIPRNAFWNDNLGLWAEAASRYPDKLRIQYNLGHAQILEGRMSQAERSFERALNLNPEDDLSYAALGYCAEVKGDWLGAKVHYERALELNSSNGYAVDGLHRAESELRRIRSESDFRGIP